MEARQIRGAGRYGSIDEYVNLIKKKDIIFIMVVYA